MPNFGTLNKERNPVSPLSLDHTRVIASQPSDSFLSVGDDPKGGITLPMVMATIMVFMQLGRPFDQFLTGFHIPAIIGSIAIIVTLFTPWPATIRTKAGVSLILFLAIMCIASVFSIWRGGSAVYVQQYVELNIAVFCLLGAAPVTVGQIRWLATAALLGCIFNFVVGARFDTMGRLNLTDEMYGNSDDVALIGGLCIPLVLLVAARMGKIFGTIIGAAGVVACLAMIFLSAARFGLISLAVIGLVYFFRASAAQKVALVVCFGVLAVGSVFLLPKNTIERLSTITSVFSSDVEISGEVTTTSEALASMEERKQLTKDAFEAFTSHPILGVGPDVFVDWRWNVLHRRGQPAHDTYLQAAAENGVLGVIFYVAFLLAIFKALQRCTKPMDGWEDGRQIAFAIQTCLIYFIVSALFLNCLSHAHQFVFAGLAIALDRLREKRAEANSEETEPVPIATAEAVPPSPKFVRPLPPRTRSAENKPAAAPARPERYRFNRPVTSSRRD